MKRLLIKVLTIATLVAALALLPVTSAFAMSTPTTGQPGASSGVACGSGSASNTPGGSSGSSGAPFNEAKPGQADTVYAGNPGTASLQNSNSTAAVSQYDVACLQVTTH